MPHVVRYLRALMLACAVLLGAPAAFAVDSGDVIVVSSRGEVHITMNGAERSVRAGGVLEMPASVRTGRDGSVELKQGATTVSVGPETLLEFPALEKRGAPIDRIQQPRGNAFYNIGKREGRKLRVETPYLVGVIKGTQFNVAAEGEATTISLFEGLLEVRATDDSDVVDLKAGEIASRKRGDRSISIIKMDAGKAPPTGSRPASGGGSNDGAPAPAVPRVTPSNEGGESLLVDRSPINVRADVDLNADVRADGSSVEAGTAANVSLGKGVDLAANVATNLGPSGVDVVTTVGVDAGPIATDIGVSAVVDVPAGTVDVATGVGVDAGPLTTDVATSAAVDLPAGTVDTTIDVGVSTPVVDVGLGAAAVVDVGAGAIDLGVTAAGADVDLGVTVPNTVGTVTDTVTDTVVDVGGLLNGLLRQPGRK